MSDDETLDSVNSIDPPEPAARAVTTQLGPIGSEVKLTREARQGCVYRTAAHSVMPPMVDDTMSDDSEFRCDTYTTAVPIDSPGYRCSVRVVHLPTGSVASCDDTKSVVVNRERALADVRAQLRQRAIDERGSTP